MENRPTEYRLDFDNCIVGVSGPWDAFAAENGAPGAQSDAILGRRLWDFVEGHQTRALLNNLFMIVRLRGEGMKLQHRRDAPAVRRVFEMTVEPQPDDGLTVAHRLLSSSAAPGARLIAFTPQGDRSRCSIYGAVRVGDKWFDPFALADERFFIGAYGVCPECAASTAALDRDPSTSVIPLRPLAAAVD
jgi:hypothetical protein